MPSVKIDPSYWSTVKCDYSDWKFAWAREAGQNSLDAGATKIVASVWEDKPGITAISWYDNGCGMSEDILVNKFLALGGSFKANGNTGGFGVAKSILAFAQRSYTICTGNIRLTGVGSEYEIERIENYLKGTHLLVSMEDVNPDDVRQKITDWARWTTTPAAIWLDGSKLETLRLPAKPKRSLSWCDIYVHNIGDERRFRTRVRINGQYMFSIWSNVPRHVTVELTGESAKYLTANRDGLNWIYQDKLIKILAQIFQDPKTVTNTDIDHFRFYNGTKGNVSLKRDRRESSKPPGRSKIDLGATGAAAKSAALASVSLSPSEYLGNVGEQGPKYEAATQLDGYNFVVLNNLNRAVPSRWLPENLSKHGRRLMRRWIALLEFCAPYCGVTADICVGWVFNASTIAMKRYERGWGNLVLLNPTKVENNRLKQRWDNTSHSFYDLVATAVHELTHFEHDGHGENFANALTENLGKVMRQYPALEILRKRTV